MLRRFVSASAVASVLIAIGAAVMFNVPGSIRDRFLPVIFLWLSVPALWGVWAMLTPSAWIPQRLPFWGGVLGILAAALGAVVLNLPLVVTGRVFSLPLRFVSLPFAAAIYYVLWLVVRRVYVGLQPEAEPRDPAALC